MIGPITVTVCTHISWWVRPALAVLSLLASIYPCQAIGNVLAAVLLRGVRVEVSR